MSYTPKQLATAYPIQNKESLEELSSIDLALNAGLHRVLLDPRKSLNEKITQINNIFPNLSKNSQNFLRIIISEKLVKKFSKILDEYQKILASSVTTGEIITASEISETELQNILSKINQKTGKTVILSTKVNPKIIGGVVLKIGNITIDKSFRTRLKALR